MVPARLRMRQKSDALMHGSGRNALRDMNEFVIIEKPFHRVW